MKRIICMLLIVSCVAVLFACGNNADNNANNEGVDAETAQFFEKVQQSDPTGITTKTHITRPNGVVYEGYYTTTITENGFVFDYEYQQRNEEFVVGEDSVETVNGLVKYEDGRYTHNGENVSAAPDVDYMNISLELVPQNVDEFTFSKDKKTLTSTITKEQVENIFGVKIDAENALLKITINGTYLTKIELNYTTADGTVVYVETGFVYVAAQE